MPGVNRRVYVVGFMAGWLSGPISQVDCAAALPHSSFGQAGGKPGSKVRPSSKPAKRPKPAKTAKPVAPKATPVPAGKDGEVVTVTRTLLTQILAGKVDTAL